MENLTGGTPPVRYLPCVVPCKLYFIDVKITIDKDGYLKQYTANNETYQRQSNINIYNLKKKK